ncbi:DUF7144 family membrane protein [Streptomyces sp. GSL17-111]|uniref:DUF7144 family membrane protein n=1 Tax=Streptomyces sp. GSL17-111 TaxID=3121596 RepID=UPI0030F3B246
MASSTHSRSGGSTHDRDAWASGGTVFAGVLALVYGVIGVLQGIAGIAKDDVYGTIGDYTYAFDTTSWGWIHLVLGVIVALTGLGILMGATWARFLGVFLAGLVIIANFVWLPYQPLWGLVNIALGVFVIWALATSRSSFAD